MSSRASAVLATFRERSDLGVPLAIFVCIAHAMWTTPLDINHDVALNLSLAQKLLDGQTPYVDFVEINPPLMIYMNVPPVLLGGVFGVAPIIVFNILALGLCIWSTLSIRKTMLALELPGRGIVLATWAGLAWLIHASGDFAQREHQFVLAYVPFLFVRVASWSDRPMPRGRAGAIGAVAGLMMALKPQFVLCAIVLELVWLARQRRALPLKAPEWLAVVGVGAAYLLHFAIVPSVAAAYVDALPDLMLGYSAFKAPWTTLLDPTLIVLPAAAACVALVGRPLAAREPASELRVALAVFTTAAFALIYLWPRNIFPYHVEPARHGALLIVAIMLVGSSHRLPRALVAVVAVATVIFATSVILRTRAAGPPPRSKLAAFIQSQTKPGESVMWLNCAVPPTYPMLVQIDRRNASRYSFLAVILGAFDATTFAAHVREDMKRHHPNILIVTRDCMSRSIPLLLEQTGLMTDAFGDFREIDVTPWYGGPAPFVLFERAK